MSYIEVDVSGKALFNHERYRISVLRCCEEWCSPVKKIERRTREYYSLHFIIGGKGTLVYEVNIRLNYRRTDMTYNHELKKKF